MAKGMTYVGAKHFDWSYIQTHYPNDDVVTLLRDPADRAISHFHFMQKLSWTKTMKIREPRS